MAFVKKKGNITWTIKLVSLPGNYQKPAGCCTCRWLRETEIQFGCDEARRMAAGKLKVPSKRSRGSLISKQCNNFIVQC